MSLGRNSTGWERSFWANPYEFDLSQVPQKEVRSLDQHSVRMEMLNSVVRFERSLRLARREPFKTMQARIGELRGKVLGCQCCTYDGVARPVPWCHAASLAHFVNTWKGEGVRP